MQFQDEKTKDVEDLTEIISIYQTFHLKDFFDFFAQHLQFVLFFVSVDSSSTIEKIEVPGRKNKICREFDGDHILVLDLVSNLRQNFLSLISNITVEIFVNVNELAKKFKKFSRQKTNVESTVLGFLNEYTVKSTCHRDVQ